MLRMVLVHFHGLRHIIVLGNSPLLSIVSFSTILDFLTQNNSKAALSMLTIQYWNRLKTEGFMVHGSDPGLNATNLTHDPESLKARGAPHPSIGAEKMASVVRGERDADAGRVCAGEGVNPW
jgi:hypothetical protein